MHGHICEGRRTAFQELGLLPIYNVVSLVSAVTAFVHTQLILLSPLLSLYESSRVMAVSHQICSNSGHQACASGITPAGVSLAIKIFLNSPWERLTSPGLSSRRKP